VSEDIGKIDNNLGEEYPDTEGGLLALELLVNGHHPYRESAVIELPVHVTDHPQDVDHAWVAVYEVVFEGKGTLG